MTGRYSLSWALIEKVPCTHCGAKAGDRCRTPKGVPAAPHGPRRDAAAAAKAWVPGGKARTP
jgi:hypothetical protein